MLTYSFWLLFVSTVLGCFLAIVKLKIVAYFLAGYDRLAPGILALHGGRTYAMDSESARFLFGDGEELLRMQEGSVHACLAPLL